MFKYTCLIKPLLGNNFSKFIPTLLVSQKRFLNIHEYQSKLLMKSFNIRVQQGGFGSSPEEVENLGELVLKAQILAGGRGKGVFENGFKGGVHICKTIDEVVMKSKKMLNHFLKTKQTPPDGIKVEKVGVYNSINFSKEYYLSIILDRASGSPIIIASSHGGVDIEALSLSYIHKRRINFNTGLTLDDINFLTKKLGFSKDSHEFNDLVEQIKNLYAMFVNTDALQIEINPLVISLLDHKVYCLDAKLIFDDNAFYRQNAIFDMKDQSTIDPKEIEAQKININYIHLGGNIGCMVNGAGLAMATMDVIKAHGGEPANFLDVGGGAGKRQIEQAFRILLGDSQVECILVNIFGGITRCDFIAQSILEVAKKINISVPLVVRLEGTNSNKGREILEKSDISSKIIFTNDLDSAAEKAVEVLGLQKNSGFVRPNQ